MPLEERNKQAYIDAVERRMAHWIREIDRLRVAADAASPEDRPRLQRLLSDLADRRRTVEVRLDELKVLEDVRWRDLQENVARAEHAFETALETSSQKVRKLTEK